MRSFDSQTYELKDLRAECVYTYYGMYAKYVKENLAEMYGRKWDTFNEAKIVFHQWEHVFAADQKKSLSVVLLDCLMHHCDAQSLREECDTGVADDRRLASSDGKFVGVIPEHTQGFDF